MHCFGVQVTPLVSVVLPAHNATRTLLRAVECIRAQTLADWELVAVDDGSTDGTGEILVQLAQAERRIRMLAPGRVGLIAALNAGLAAARGRLIARMDADDEMHPERLAAQADMLRAKPELWLRWLEAGVRMAKVPRMLLTWYDSPGRLSRTDPRYSPEAFFRMKAEYVAKEVARVLRMSQSGAARRDVSPYHGTWIWGAGRPTRKRAAHLVVHGLKIAGYIDVDVKKTGKTIGGVPVILPAELPPPGRVFVLGYVSSRGAREFIRGDLVRRGYVEGEDFLMCA